MRINIFWFRRDLRLDDNTALDHALKEELPVLCLFIFDTDITDELPVDDPRISFIYKSLREINKTLRDAGSSIFILKGNPVERWEELIVSFEINAVYLNKDYEPYAIQRDNSVEKLLERNGIRLFRFKDQVVLEEDEVVKSDGTPYTVFTPYKKRWLRKYKDLPAKVTTATFNDYKNFYSENYLFPEIEQLGFRKSNIPVRPYDLSVIPEYDRYRNFPAADRTSYLSPHLRFGTISIRKLASRALSENMSFLNELIWREFFMQILFHFPGIVTENFKPAYDEIEWRNDEGDFRRWCNGETGFPIVDAGMRQLNTTGYMHNRVRMITAGFLCKHLLIDWRSGEAYFASKLLDNELSSNNGNWQWAAGTGCDAVPYFRIFNPEAQQKKYDPQKEYIKRWVEDINNSTYQEKIVEHEFARQRALDAYRSGIRRRLKTP